MPPKGSQPVRPLAATSKRRRDDDSDDDLSDLSDTPTTHKASESDDDDEQDDDEISSDSDSPDGEVEDSYASISFHSQPPSPRSRANMELTSALYSYASEELADSDDDDSEMLELPTKATAKNVAQRAVAGRRAPPQTLSRGQAVSKKRSTATGRKVGSTTTATAREPVPDPMLRQLPRRRNTRSSYTSGTQGQGISATSAPAPTIKLKIGKDRLRQVTKTWTPPPGAAADSGTAASTAAPTPESTASGPAKAMRGRKVVEYEEDEDEDAEGVEDDEMELDAEGVEDDELIDEDAEGETDDEMLSDDASGTPGTDFMSRTGTPDMSRLTNRQRTRLGDITTADHLLELPSGYGMIPSRLFCPRLTEFDRQRKTGSYCPRTGAEESGDGEAEEEPHRPASGGREGTLIRGNGIGAPPTDDLTTDGHNQPPPQEANAQDAARPGESSWRGNSADPRRSGCNGCQDARSTYHDPLG